MNNPYHICSCLCGTLYCLVVGDNCILSPYWIARNAPVGCLSFLRLIYQADRLRCQNHQVFVIFYILSIRSSLLQFWGLWASSLGLRANNLGLTSCSYTPISPCIPGHRVEHSPSLNWIFDSDSKPPPWDCWLQLAGSSYNSWVDKANSWLAPPSILPSYRKRGFSSNLLLHSLFHLPLPECPHHLIP